MKAINKVLIANRGEIAVRIIRACRDLGLKTVAVYSDADESSRHRFMADEAYRLEGRASSETYLDMAKLKSAIERSKADAVHPGYGFLSENSDFAQMVVDLGVKFIGPSPESMRKLGDKIEAKHLMIEHEVPVVPGSDAGLKSWEDIKAVSEKTGYPLILKAAAGGGGRGMRIVRSHEELKDAFEACTREAVSFFGNPEIFCERYLENPRHIEIQVLCDAHGNGVHFFERDCSVQRRHQKLIEEAPSVFLNEEQRMRLGEFAVSAAKAAHYEGAGTVEFICESPEKCYFMEMNTRIQVEHPVTEMISGVDLIREQIRVAMGEKLGYSQEDIGKPHGHSIELRLNAEEPTKNFMAAPGLIKRLELPSGPHVRVDTHVYEGYQIPADYDSMFAKLIIWAPNRKQCIERTLRALLELKTEGIPTTAKFHEAVLQNEVFCSGDFNTSFVERYWNDLLDFMKKHDAQNEKEKNSEELEAFICAVLKQASMNECHLKTPSTRDNWSKSTRIYD